MRQAVALLASLSVALLVAVAVLLLRPPTVDVSQLNTQAALGNPEVK